MKTLKNDVILYFTLCYEPSQLVFDKVGVLDKCDVSSYTEYIKMYQKTANLLKISLRLLIILIDSKTA